MDLPVGIYNIGAIVMVDFPFREDNNKYKSRPAVIIGFDNNITSVVLLQVTSHQVRTMYDYEIKEYRGTGLYKKPSVVRCNCVFTIANSKTVFKIGDLSRNDLLAINILYNQAIKQNLVEYYNKN